MKKQPTTKQRFDQTIKAIDLMSDNAGIEKNITRSATVNGILECIKHLKHVHLSGGDAGKFLNEMEAVCRNYVARRGMEAIEKLNARAAEITDEIVKPEEN